jgi:lipoate-protein ligase A
VESVTVRLLPFATADGPRNMAADEVLLEAAGTGVASLRFYGWAEATVSLGYFQPHRVREAEPALAALPFVRRPSGGAALVHHHELTYALALPSGSPWQATACGSAWLCRMHEVVAAALATRGVATRAAEGRPGAGDAVLCFRQHARGDLVIGHHKVVGSAQRRRRGALVQHGSVLFSASPHAPALAGVADLVGVCLGVEDVQTRVVEEFARQTGWAVTPAEWEPGERRRVEELAVGKYARPEWNRRR